MTFLGRLGQGAMGSNVEAFYNLKPMEYPQIVGVVLVNSGQRQHNIIQYIPL